MISVEKMTQKELKAKFAVKLKEFMKRDGYAISDIASYLNLDENTVAYHLNPKDFRMPTAICIVNLSKLFKCSVDELLGLEW